jgi:hypothetical protein
MLFGPQSATIASVRELAMHGERLFDVTFLLDGEAHGRSARLGAESLPAMPQPGDRVRIHFLMDTVLRIEAAPS